MQTNPARTDATIKNPTVGKKTVVNQTVVNPIIADMVKQLLPMLDDDDTAVIAVDLRALNARLGFLRDAFPAATDHAIAIKTNPHPCMLSYLVKQGFGLEAASMEEVQMALAAGARPAQIIFDSPVKTHAEIQICAAMAGMLVNANSLAELTRYPTDLQCILGLRINPEVNIGSPELFDVSVNESKFGVPYSRKSEIIDAALRFPITALHMHSGSQMAHLDVQITALQTLLDLAQDIDRARAEHGIPWRIETIDIGGGLKAESLSSDAQMAQYGRRLVEACPQIERYHLRTEFGQWVHAPAGFALSRVEYVEHGHAPKAFIHLGADFFMRDAYTKPRPFPLAVLTPTGEIKQTPAQQYDIAGPLCFAGDYLGKQVVLPQIAEGDWLYIGETGANTYGLWSRHCSRTVPKTIALHDESTELWSGRQAISA